ncbi:NADAR family protein [Oscillatoria amoena NRMC-F 0135]|nr:NADAR family protein [Oscillatoria amoena NRMC-F 0135]
MMEEQFTFFYRTAHPFSQWYECNYEIDGIHFNTAEQCMMYGKAMLFGDVEIAQKVLTVKHPRDQKALGRQVKNFIPEVWEREAKNIVYKANYAKFTQNENLKKILVGYKRDYSG